MSNKSTSGASPTPTNPNLIVSYVAQAPLWKPTYRLVLARTLGQSAASSVAVGLERGGETTGITHTRAGLRGRTARVRLLLNKQHTLKMWSVRTERQARSQTGTGRVWRATYTPETPPAATTTPHRRWRRRASQAATTIEENIASAKRSGAAPQRTAAASLLKKAGGLPPLAVC